MSKEPERLGKYELLERLGQGGMGDVLKARDTQLRRYVAIKFLHADLQNNPDFITHFMREAQFIASLSHPNIIQIHDFQLTDTRGSGITAYMVMNYIEGGTLADYIRSTSRKGLFPPAADIVYLFTAISLALDYAHQKGMIHRDIKPANILLDKRNPMGKPMGEPILTDFGIARLQGGGVTTLNVAGIGTPLYISPEQAKGLPADEHSDLYSLGIILYEILTGITPFRGDSPLAIMFQHLQEMPPPPNLINPQITPALSEVMLRSIAKDPDARFPSASAMTVALARALEVPVPSSLSKPKSTHEQPDHNPLQPSTPLSGVVFHTPTLTASPPAPFTPASAGYSHAQFNSPAPLTPVMGDQALQEPPVTPMPPAQPRRPRRGLYIALIACILILLVGVGAFTIPSLFTPKGTTPTPNPSSSIVGQIVFINSPNAAHNTYDQLQVTLGNIPPPPAGKTYYAWLENSNSEASAIPHWALQVSSGSVHNLYPGNAQHTDLLAQSTLLLITEEDASSTPIIPFPDLSKHLYYALITHTSSSSSPTFEVRQCPGSTSSGANPCA